MSQVQIYMPPPLNWQDFQTLIGEIAESKYAPDSVQEYGRQGQCQHGIDVYAVDYFGKIIGIQCKETKKEEAITEKIICTEAQKASSFSPSLDLFIIATTQRIDAKIQNIVNELNKKKSYKFTIQIWFWDDINRDINRSFLVMSSCYKEIQAQFGIKETQNHLNLVRIAFDRPAFKDDFLHERNYDDFENALVTTKQMLRTGFLFDRFGTLIGNTFPSDMVGDEEYKKFISKIERKLEHIYQEYLKDKKKFAVQPQLIEERAGFYNIKRRDLITILNKKFYEENLNAIYISY